MAAPDACFSVRSKAHRDCEKFGGRDCPINSYMARNNRQPVHANSSGALDLAHAIYNNLHVRAIHNILHVIVQKKQQYMSYTKAQICLTCTWMMGTKQGNFLLSFARQILNGEYMGHFLHIILETPSNTPIIRFRFYVICNYLPIFPYRRLSEAESPLSQPAILV